MIEAALLLLGVLTALLGADLSSGGGSGSDDDEDPTLPRNEEDELNLGDTTYTSTQVLLVDGGTTDPLTYEGDAPEATSTEEAIERFEDESDRDIDTRDDLERFFEGDVTGSGGEALFGDEGDNRLSGSDGNDLAIGFEGDDTLFLGEGDDVVFGLFEAEGRGDDSIRGGRGDDALADHLGENTLRGDAGDDTIDGRDIAEDRGADLLIGGFGNDEITADRGDTVSGGEGSDLIENHVHEDATTEDAVTITDFDPDVDTLNVYIETDEPQRDDAYDIELRENPEDADETQLFVNDLLVARLTGEAELVGRVASVGNFRDA